MTFLNEEQINSLDKKSIAMIIKTLQGQIMLLDTTNKKLSVQLEAATETTQKLLAQVEALTAQIRLSNQRHFGKSSEKSATIDGQMSLFDYYSELFNEAGFLRMILKNLISMKSPSLTKGKRNLVNEKLIYLIFQQGYSIILFLNKSLVKNILKVTMNSLQKYTSGFSLFQKPS